MLYAIFMRFWCDFGNDFGDKVHVVKAGVNYRFNFYDPRRY